MPTFPYELSETPASFDSALLGRTVRDKKDRTFVLCKNTDAAALTSGLIVTLETPASYYVDICATTEMVFGVVPNELTGDSAAVNDAVWIQTRGLCYVSKGLATGSAAIAIGDALKPRNASGQVAAWTGTIGHYSLDAVIIATRMQARTAVASSATTQVLVWLD